MSTPTLTADLRNAEAEQAAADRAADLRNAEAAAIIGVAPPTLSTWRSKGRGPRFVKCGKSVRYRRADLDAWLQSRTVETAESVAAR